MATPPKDSHNAETGFPSLQWEEEDLPTRPMPIHEMPLEFRIEHELNIIESYHPRIAESIRKFWGHRDCVEYLQTLIVQGNDGDQRNRAGFKAAVSDALMTLVNLHKLL